MFTVNRAVARLIWLVVAAIACFGAWKAVTSENVYGFALLTAAVTAIVSTSLEWRRINLERVLFYHGPRGRVGTVGVILFTSVSVFLRAIATGVAAIFTFPATSKLATAGPEVIRSYAEIANADMAWTLLCLAVTAAIGLLILLITDWGFKAKTERWSYFRMPIVLGLVFSSLIITVNDASKTGRLGDYMFSQEIFPAPSLEAASVVFRTIFGNTINDAAFSKYTNELVAERNELASQFNQLSERAGDLQNAAGDTLALLQDIRDENRGNICRVTSKVYETTSGECQTVKERVKVLGAETPIERIIKRSECRRPFTDDDGNWLVRRVFDGAKEFDSAKSQLWHLFECGVRVSADAGEEPDLEPWCRLPGNENQPGCRDTGGELRAARARFETASALLGVKVAEDVPPRPEPITVSADNLPALITLLDGYFNERIQVAIDRLVTNQHQRAETANAFVPGRAVEVSAQATPSWLEGSVCIGESPSEHSWCRNPIRRVLQIPLAPYIIQGPVIAVFLTLLMFPLQRTRSNKDDLKALSDPKSPIWKYREAE